MVEDKRRVAAGWINKADINLRAAREHLKKGQYSEAMQRSQECVELSVKAILHFLDIEFSFTHGWKASKDSFDKIAQEIQARRLLPKLAEKYNYLTPLPRLLFLANFWGDFYIEAKYGYEKGNLASAQELFKKEEAELAEKHATECYISASQIRNLKEEELAVLCSKDTDKQSRRKQAN